MRRTPGVSTRTVVKDYIMRKLGAPVIKVELHESQLDVCYDSALELYSQYCPPDEALVAFTTQSYVNGYDVPEEYLGVREVFYNPHLSDFFLNEFFNEYFIDDWARLVHMTDYWIQTMYNEMYIRTLGREGTWEMIGNKLYLFPTPVKSQKVIAKVQFMAEDEDIRYIDWIRDYALAEAKEILGRIRSKYQSMPGPRGDLTLDGDRLLTESESMKEKLREELLQLAEPVGFITG